MKTKSMIISAIFALSSVASLAGYVQDVPVEVDMEGMFAHGNMKNARYSENEFEFIGCGTRTYAATDTSPAFQWGFCQASVAEGETAFCSTFDNPELLNQIKAAASYSYITFRWNENGECTYIGNSTQSFYLPQAKKEAK